MATNTDRERRAVEAQMDEMLAESFPASDPPVWGSAAARMQRLEAAESGLRASTGSPLRLSGAGS